MWWTQRHAWEPLSESSFRIKFPEPEGNWARGINMRGLKEGYDGHRPRGQRTGASSACRGRPSQSRLQQEPGVHLRGSSQTWDSVWQLLEAWLEPQAGARHVQKDSGWSGDAQRGPGAPWWGCSHLGMHFKCWLSLLQLHGYHPHYATTTVSTLRPLPSCFSVPTRQCY